MSTDHEKIHITWSELERVTDDETQIQDTCGPPPGDSTPPAQIRPRSSAPIVIAVICGLVTLTVGALILWSVGNARRNDPMTTVSVIESINTELDLQKHKDYFTPNGYGVMQWLISESSAQQGSGTFQLSYGPPQVTENLCRVWGTSHNTRLAIQLVMHDRWLFDDLYIASVEGQEVNLLASYIRDNPIKAVLRVGWPDFLYGFLQGVLIGLGAH